MQFQTRVMFFGRAKTSYIIAKHGTVHKIIAFKIIHNHLFVVLILDREWPLSSGCEMTCFCYITGTTILFILLANKTLNRLGFGMLTVGTAILYWLITLTTLVN